jgi:hypothetical protein
MGPASVPAHKLAAWFVAKAPPGYQVSEPVEQLAQFYIEEGEAEGVRGDVAFIQSVIETGWFRFGGQVRPEDNNFAGLGATDGSGHANVASFPDARTGVRAQIQHLRRYADPTATSSAALHHDLVDGRFGLVQPPGKAPMWSQFGNGVWASSRDNYGGRILMLTADMLGS